MFYFMLPSLKLKMEKKYTPVYLTLDISDYYISRSYLNKREYITCG